MKKQKVLVSERALIARINRKLSKDDERLKTARGARNRERLGRYYIVALEYGRTRPHVGGNVDFVDVDLVKKARELGVLQGWEELG